MESCNTHHASRFTRMWSHGLRHIRLVQEPWPENSWNPDKIHNHNKLIFLGKRPQRFLDLHIDSPWKYKWSLLRNSRWQSRWSFNPYDNTSAAVLDIILDKKMIRKCSSILSGSSLDGLTDHKTSWNGILQKKIELKLTAVHNFLDMTLWRRPSWKPSWISR